MYMAIWALVSGLYKYYTSERARETGDLCNFGPIRANLVNFGFSLGWFLGYKQPVSQLT